MPNWSDFQKKHILNPAEAPNWQYFNRKQWNEWLQNRLQDDFGHKRVNSVVVSTPETIAKDFEALNHGVGSGTFFTSFASFTIIYPYSL